MILRYYLKEKEKIALKNELEKEAIRKILIDCFYENLNNLLDNLNNEVDEKIFDSKVNLYLEDKIPVQYITGFTYFYDCKINVSKDCLIPRAETEILVSKVIDVIKENNYQKVLEIGTGSGAISIALKKKMTNIMITATDICSKALAIAQKNAIINDVDIEYIESDLFENIEGKYDIIISNPPYIAYDDPISSIVYNNEPHKALFACDFGLYFYKQIIKESVKYLTDKASIIFEIGMNQAKQIKESINFQNYDCFVIKDYSNLDRILIININGK